MGFGLMLLGILAYWAACAGYPFQPSFGYLLWHYPVNVILWVMGILVGAFTAVWGFEIG